LFDLPPHRGEWPEIWIASHGPRMLRATGRYADVWFPAMIVGPVKYAEGLGKVRAPPMTPVANAVALNAPAHSGGSLNLAWSNS
jgi:hypothetical protein